MRTCFGIVCLLHFLAAGFSQQIGNPNRDYLINGTGGGQASLVTSGLSVPSSVTNAYRTLDPLAPVLWIASPVSTIGWYHTPANSVDVGPAPLLILGNGADPTSPFSSTFRTDTSGNFNLTVPAPGSLVGTQLHLAMLHLTLVSSDGFFISQTHRVSFVLDPNLSPSNTACLPGGLPLVLTDDSFLQRPLGFSYPFYGTTYPDLFVGSNGYVTFGSGDGSYGFSATTFLSSYPRIAAWWDDLNPASGGTVSFFSDGVGTAEVCFQNIPEYPGTGQNTFKTTLASGLFVTMDYGPMSANSGLVGLTPGNNAASGVPLNLSLAPHSLPGASGAPYELFTSSSPNDLPGFQVNFIMDAGGNPMMMF